MKTILNLKSFGEVKLSARIIDGDAQFSNSTANDRYNHHYKFRVYVTYNGKKASFTYMTSYNDWLNGVEELSDDDFRNAFSCFLTDAISSADSFDDFCYAFDYSNDSIKALRIYKTCKRSYKSATRLFGNSLSDVLEDLGEY